MPEITDEELAAFKKSQDDATTLKATNERLLAENTKTKSRAQEAEDKISDAAKKKLEEEGKTNELLAQERKEKIALKEKLDNRTKSVLKEKVRSAVSKHAKDALDVDDLLSINDKELKALLKVNEDELSVEGVEEFVTKARELKPHFFGKKRMDDFNNKKGDNKDDKEDFDKTDEQRYQEELKNVNTRKELAAVRKKYGKSVDNYRN